MRKANNITWGLFPYKTRYFWKNLRDIPLVFERIFFALKHGYAPQAQWETDTWFIEIMKEILTYHRNERFGMPVVIENFKIDGSTDEENLKAWNDILDRMLTLLELMKEWNPIYEDWDWTEVDAAMENAKAEFFELFSKYFYNLWD